MTASSNLPSLDNTEQAKVEQLLHTFTTRHQSDHRPIALVTSGGTAADLELQAVRFLDNFSTGLRGAISVEEFCRRGYAVIHLWRIGSAAPYSRVLGRLLGCRAGNHGLGFDALGNLFEGQSVDEVVDDSCDQVDDIPTPIGYGPKSTPNEKHGNTSRMNLTNQVLNSNELETKLKERRTVVQNDLLLTIPYRTVEEYLAKLKLCSEALRSSQSLGLIYLAAAVSDFYIPREKKSLHKIQSRDYGLPGSKNSVDDANGSTSSESASVRDGLTLNLHPVPKCILHLRQEWAPDAFCASFKLETDISILSQKASMAMDKYKVHMVIGNILATRHEKVWVLQNKNTVVNTSDESKEGGEPEIVEIQKSLQSKGAMSDELEDALISHVVKKHFEFITNHPSYNSDDGKGIPKTSLPPIAQDVVKMNSSLFEKKKQLRRDLFWRRITKLSLNLGKRALEMYLTYVISNAIRMRSQRSTS